MLMISLVGMTIQTASAQVQGAGCTTQIRAGQICYDSAIISAQAEQIRKQSVCCDVLPVFMPTVQTDTVSVLVQVTARVIIAAFAAMAPTARFSCPSLNPDRETPVGFSCALSLRV